MGRQGHAAIPHLSSLQVVIGPLSLHAALPGNLSLHTCCFTLAVGCVQGPALRLAVATHLSVNDYAIVPIISAIRSTYPDGPLAIAQVRMTLTQQLEMPSHSQPVYLV